MRAGVRQSLCRKREPVLVCWDSLGGSVSLLSVKLIVGYFGSGSSVISMSYKYREMLVDSTIAAIPMDNYVDIVRTVFNTYTGASFGPSVVSLPGYSDPAYQSTLQTTDASDSVVCSNGETGELSAVTSGDRVLTKITFFDFNNCQDGDNLIDGQFERILDDNLDVSSAGLVVRREPVLYFPIKSIAVYWSEHRQQHLFAETDVCTENIVCTTCRAWNSCTAQQYKMFAYRFHDR